MVKTYRCKFTQDISSRNVYDFIRPIERATCKVLISKGNISADAKSLLGVMRIGLSTGDEVELVINGTYSEAESVLEGIKDFVEIK